MTKKIKEAAGPSGGVYGMTGIPVLGAIGGGDGYKDKIGKNRRPPFHGDTGSPSHSADAGWSSQGMSRVNKGYEQDVDLFYDVMFPEQEDEENISDEENIYYMYDELPLITRKLPQHSIRLKPHSKYIKSPSELAEIKESYMTKKQYSLKPLFEDTSRIRLDEFDMSNIGFPDIDLPDINLSFEIPGMEFLEDLADKPAEIVADTLGPVADLILPALDSIQDLAGDLLAAGVAIVPVFGDVAALGFVAFNIAQLQGDLAKADSAIAAFQANPTDKGRDLLAEILNDLNTNVIDVFQRLLEALPDPGASELTSASISVRMALESIEQSALRLRSLLSRIGFRHSSDRVGFGQRMREKAQVTLVVKPAMLTIVSLVSDEQTPENISSHRNELLRLIPVMAALYDLITVWDAHGEVADILGLDEIDQMASEEPAVAEIEPEPMITSFSDAPEYDLGAESFIRDFVKELVLSEYAQRYTVNLRGPNPAGYLSYDPKELGEQPEVFSDDDVTDFNLNAVLYPGDGGYNAYSPKPLSESNIKDFIREMILETLSDDDITEDDHPDHPGQSCSEAHGDQDHEDWHVNEYSAGGVPGAAMPMQTGSKKNTRNG